MRPAERLGRCRWGARRRRPPRSLRRPFANGNPRRCQGRPPPAVPWATDPLHPPHATRNQIAHQSRPPATGSAPHRRSAAKAAPPSLPQRGQRPLQVPPPPRTGPPRRPLPTSPPLWNGPPATLPPTPAARRRRTVQRPRPAALSAGQMGHHLAVLKRPQQRPLAPPSTQMAPKLAGWSDQQPRPQIPPTGRMAHRLAVPNRPPRRPLLLPPAGHTPRPLAVGDRRRHRPPGLRGGWRGSRDWMSRRVGPDGRPWAPLGGRTPRWTPPSTGRRARRRFGPGRCARRDPGRVSGPPPTRAVASSARPPTLRPRDPARGR
jgi:hypothetical protein